MKPMAFLLSFILAHTCGEKTGAQEEASANFEGRYVHAFEDCKPTTPYETCIEFLEFRSGSRFASLLYGGGDVVREMNYEVKGNTLILTEEMGGRTLTFFIKGKRKLVRQGTDDVWVLQQ